MSAIGRRDFLAASLAATPCSLLLAQEQTKLDLAFFFVADTHYLADKKDTSKLDPRCVEVNTRLVEHLNTLPGSAIPKDAGGGTVATPKGVIHGGDLIDTGDKNGAEALKMQQTEWAGYADEFGLTGKEGKLKYPVYEVHGNHDSPAGDGLAVKKIIERNKKRSGVKNVSNNGLHYSWDWGPVHFVALGIVVGTVKEVKRKRKYNPLDSLDFLIDDLKQNVGTSGRPVVLLHHVDVRRNSTKPDPDAPTSNKEWDPCDVRGYHDALKAYNVAAVLYGHTHGRAVFQWDGTQGKTEKGVSVFNVHTSSHFAAKEHGLFYFHLREGEMIVRELRSKDRWQTANWTAQTWKSKLAVGRG